MTEVPRIDDHFDFGIILRDTAQNIHRAIGRMVIDDDVLITILRKIGKQLANTFDQNQSMATVSAVGANAAGANGVAVDLYGADAAYYFSATGSSNLAYTFRASTQPPGSANIELYLPNLFTSVPSISMAPVCGS